MTADFFTRWAGETWWNLGANVIQWATIVTWAALLWTLWHQRCHEPWCVRPGQVPVGGSEHKVCRKHAKRGGHVHP